MKKKIGLFFCVLFGVCAISGGCFIANSVHNDVNYVAMYAEGESAPTEEQVPEFEKKVYTHSEDGRTVKITLISETEFEIEAQEEGSEPMVFTGTYVKDGTTLILKNGENEMKVTIDEKNMTFGEYVETFECKVVLGEFAHGEITMDKNEGHVGDVVTLTVKPTLLYLVEYVKVNGVNLVESEETKWSYSFALVEGENKIEAKFAVDKELLGEMSTVYEQATNKDWTHLFSLENVLRLVSFVLNGGLLMVMVRYFVQDKKIANSVESGVKKSMDKLIPETTKQAVLENTKEVLKPMFTQVTAYQEDIIRVTGILVKCIALMQEDTPDSRRAILAELANLNIGDMKVVEEAKKFIDDYFAKKMSDMQGVMNDLDEIINKNKQTAEKVGEALANPPEQKEEDVPDNGTQI